MPHPYAQGWTHSWNGYNGISCNKTAHLHEGGNYRYGRNIPLGLAAAVGFCRTSERERHNRSSLLFDCLKRFYPDVEIHLYLYGALV